MVIVWFWNWLHSFSAPDMTMTYDDVKRSLCWCQIFLRCQQHEHPPNYRLLKVEAVMTADITSINIQNLCKGRLHEEAMERVKLMSFK